MEQIPTPKGPDVDRLMVPEALLYDLKVADDRLHMLRKELEETTDDCEYSHADREGRKFAELREAERLVEEVSEKIRKIVELGP